MLLACVANRNNVKVQITADGWNEVGSTRSAFQLQSVVLTRVATPSEPSAYTFHASEPTPLVASITGFANVDRTDPVDRYGGAVNGATQTLRTPPVTTRVGNELAVWFGTQVYNAADCDLDLISPPASSAAVAGGDCLPGSNEGLAFETAYRQLGAPAASSGWAGISDLAATNIAQVVTLRPSSRVQAADRYASFAGDIGRSNGKPNPPSTFAVYRVPEPDIAAGGRFGSADRGLVTFPLSRRRAQCRGVDGAPRAGAMYVITKKKSGVSGVYTFPQPLPAPSATKITTLTKAATLHMPTWTGSAADTHAATWFAQVTAAAIHPVNRFVVRTPYRVWEYRGADGGSFQTALEGTPVALTGPANEGQGEAIEYDPDGSAYYTVSEKLSSPFTLKRVDRR